MMLFFFAMLFFCRVYFVCLFACFGFLSIVCLLLVRFLINFLFYHICIQVYALNRYVLTTDNFDGPANTAPSPEPAYDGAGR